MSELHKKLLAKNPGLNTLPPKAPVSSNHQHQHHSDGAHKRSLKNKRDYTPLPWSDYFDRFEDVLTENGQFRVYIKGDSGPVIFFLHGGGFSGLTWSILSSILVKRIKCQCYALDIRGHGDSHSVNDDDLSIETMIKDVDQVVKALWSIDTPPIILVGHSMGGALAVHLAALECIQNLVALVVIDVVEGSALEALSSMQTFLQGRPKKFNSIEQAIEYNVRIGAIRNVESARVSIIGQLKKLAVSNDTDTKEPNTDNVLIGSQSHAVMQTEIAEEDEENAEQQQQQQSQQATSSLLNSISRNNSANKTESAAASQESAEFKKPETSEKYEWRIDLTKTEKYWKDWFQGLSSMFLNVHMPKLLLLAGVDRLDKDLMVGQMQGKFQMQILPLCGHAVHEDSPDEVADAISNFMIRYKFTEPLELINPPRLSC